MDHPGAPTPDRRRHARRAGRRRPEQRRPITTQYTDAVRAHDLGFISLTGLFVAVDEMLTGGGNLVLVARLRHLRDPPACSPTTCSTASIAVENGRLGHGLGTQVLVIRTETPLLVSLSGHPGLHAGGAVLR